jgi:threonine dehydrogenase-like Zn-dependent dehydrogenase
MKQVAQNYKSGELTVLDVPVPACRPGGVLVRSLYSLISTGTEMMKVSEAQLSLVGKARARPDQVRKLLNSVAQQGAVATYQKAMNRLDSYTPLGYSLCGVVVEVGAGAEQFSVGQLVAAAGNDFALHAEVNWVPTNLCVPVPEGVAAEHAAFATVGAIAMQGVRRSEVALGETACVIGLGLIGQLVVRLLVASGGPGGRAGHGRGPLPGRGEGRRPALRQARRRGHPRGRAGAARAERRTRCGPHPAGRRRGVERSGRGCRPPGPGPGPRGRHRQDAARPAVERLLRQGAGRPVLPVVRARSVRPTYELEGVDYPAGYVRWTERRNLASFLDLVAAGSVDVTTLIDGIHPIEEAEDVYRRLGDGSLRGIGFLLSYPEVDLSAPLERTLRTPSAVPAAARSGQRRSSATSRIGFIGPATTPPRCCCRTCAPMPEPSWSRWPPPGRSPGSTPSASSGSAW